MSGKGSLYAKVQVNKSEQLVIGLNCYLLDGVTLTTTVAATGYSDMCDEMGCIKVNQPPWSIGSKCVCTSKILLCQISVKTSIHGSVFQIEHELH